MPLAGRARGGERVAPRCECEGGDDAGRREGEWSARVQPLRHGCAGGGRPPRPPPRTPAGHAHRHVRRTLLRLPPPHHFAVGCYRTSSRRRAAAARCRRRARRRRRSPVARATLRGCLRGTCRWPRVSCRRLSRLMSSGVPPSHTRPSSRPALLTAAAAAADEPLHDRRAQRRHLQRRLPARALLRAQRERGRPPRRRRRDPRGSGEAADRSGRGDLVLLPRRGVAGGGGRAAAARAPRARARLLVPLHPLRARDGCVGRLAARRNVGESEGRQGKVR